MKGNKGDSGGDSPDWLRCFQAPTTSTLSISSDSEPSQNGSSSKDDTIGSGIPVLDETSQPSQDNKQDVELESLSEKKPKSKPIEKQPQAENQTLYKRRKKASQSKTQGDECKVILPEDEKPKKRAKLHGANNSAVVSLSSDSESFQPSSPLMGDSILPEITSVCKESQIKEEKRFNDEVPLAEEHDDDGKGSGHDDDDDVKVAGDEVSEKLVGSHGCSSRLPLVLSDKVQRTKALVECEGESIDMSGDMGAVGRVVISNNTSGNPEMLLDLKGTIFRTTIVPSRTFCVVSFGQSEAKIEAIMNDFIQLKPQSNVFESETMIEGTLDGFSFDSEDETDKNKQPGILTEEGDEEGAEKKPTKKGKGKAEKSSGLTVRRGKTGGGKAPAKKATKKKSQGSKRGKAKK